MLSSGGLGAYATSNRAGKDLSNSLRLAAIGPVAKGDVREIYQKAAPAVVIVRPLMGGHGTGVVIKPDGWVLTNYHVVRGSLDDQLRLAVMVEIGRLGSDGVMRSAGLQQRALVHKVDPDLDLAVLKIVDPPANLPYVAVADRDVTPGEPVASIGHASLGLLWAIKDGEVASVGTLADALGGLAGIQCESSDAPRRGENDLVARRCRERQEVYAAQRKEIGRANPARVIQSTCATSPGDSGGPLLDRSANLVGLNSFGNEGGRHAATFHIAGSEIRKFLASVPAEATALPPDPWRDGAVRAVLGDADLDGRSETLLLFRGKMRKLFAKPGLFEVDDESSKVLFIDTDQDTFGGAEHLSVDDVMALNRFDAEVVALDSSVGSFVWYDLDNDGRLERLVVEIAAGDEAPTRRTYRLKADGSAVAVPAGTDAGKLLRADLMTASAERARAARVIALTTEQEVDEPIGVVTLPDPLRGGGEPTRVADYDTDGVPDTLHTQGAFSGGVVLDLSQRVLGGLRDGEPIDSGLLDRGGFAMSFIEDSHDRVWASYDTDGDGRFDLILDDGGTGSYLVADAWAIDTAGRQVLAPEHLGRKLVRPGLIQAGPQRSRLEQVIEKMGLSAAMASDEGLGSFPQVPPWRSKADAAEFADVEMLAVPGWPRAVIGGGDGDLDQKWVLVDLDRDTFVRSKALPEDLARFVSDGKFKADFGWLHEGSFEWAFYDSDHDGRFDLVLFSRAPETGEAQIAHRLEEKDGVARLDPTWTGGRLFQGKLFRDPKLGAAFKKIAPLIFEQRGIGS